MRGFLLPGPVKVDCRSAPKDCPVPPTRLSILDVPLPPSLFAVCLSDTQQQGLDPRAHHKHSTPTYVIPVILTGNHRLIVCAHKVCVAAFFSSPLQHTPPFLPPCRLRRRVPPRPSRGRRRGPRTPRASPSRCAPTSSAPSAASRPGPRRKGFCLCWSFFTYFYRLLFFKLGLDPVPFAA